MCRYIYFDVGCGVGMHYTHVYDCFGLSDNEISDMAWELAIECANSFGDFYSMDDAESLKESDEWDDRSFCDEDLEYTWEEYNPEKHDMHRSGGGSFLEEFES